MILVRALLGRADHDGAARPAIFRRSYAGVHLELLRCIDIRVEQNRVYQAIVVVHAVQNVVVRLRPKAVD